MAKINKKAIVAMSGGVDSSVAAKIIKDKGYKTLGIFLHFWKPPRDISGANSDVFNNFQNKCCSAEAFIDAKRVCRKIKIKLYTLDFSREFKKDIVDDFLKEYGRGNTPNPCARCNKMVKLGLLIKRARKLGFDLVASGHYARIREQGTGNKEQGNIFKLYRAKDKEKDQSYFLWALTQDELKHLIFPLGDITKNKVRKLAEEYRLPVAKKKESQEVCFIPDKGLSIFLKRYLKLKKGAIKTLDGRKLGEHKGLPLYTIGQRRGMKIGGAGPYYVVRLDYKTNALYVTNNRNDPRLFSNKLIAEKVNWISGAKPKFPLKCRAVARYQSAFAPCMVYGLKGKSDRCLVEFKKAQRAITPGQSIVFYRGDELIGGGVISK